MDGWQVPPGEKAKLDFIRSYKFTLAIENAIWPGYLTEKIIQPKRVNSIPIYIGDPLARNVFDTAGYVDITSFRTLREMIEFVLEVDCDRKLYMDMLSAPHYRNNSVPKFVDEVRITEFFDRIFSAAAGLRRISAFARMGHVTALALPEEPTEIKNEGLRAEVARLDAERRAAIAELNRIKAECEALRQSTSWRVTRPLRWLRSQL